MSDAPGHPEAGPAAWELPLAAVGLAAVIAVPLVVLGLLLGRPLHAPWTKPFWLDEFHTALLVGSDSLPQLLDRLGRGADFNPPGLYVLLRGWAVVTGGPGEGSFRLFTSLCSLSALAGLYWLLRQAAFGPAVAFVVPLAVWCASRLVVEQAFEARFYAPWLAACVWLCNGLVWLERRPNSPAAWSLVAASAVLVCTIHYFGVISLGLIAVGHVAFNWGGSAGVVRPALLLAPGPLALLGCWPLYQGQRAALGGLTWVDEATLATAAAFVDERYSWMLVTLAAGLFLVERMLSDRGEQPAPEVAGRPRLLAGAFGLAWLPVCLVIFSFVVQPVLVLRYTLVFLVGLAPLLAVLLAPVRGWLLGVGAGLVVLGGFVTVTQAYAVPKEIGMLGLLGDASRVPADAVLVFPDRDLAYRAWWYRPDDRPRIRVLFARTPGVTRRFVRTEARVCSLMAEIYPGLPTAVEAADLAGAGKVVVIDSRPLEAVRGLLPGHEWRRVAEHGAFAAYLAEPRR